jgi:hypothetical protein
MNGASSRSRLDLRRSPSQTRRMAHTYMLFDFGADEETAQKARHKLEGWKQAFRLDKKMQFKFDRGEAAAPAPAAEEVPEKPEKAEKSAKSAKAKSKAEPKAKAKAPEAAPAKNGDVKLLVRLYFSAHEKLSEQRWLDRIPSDELFKDAAPKVIHEGETDFPDAVAQFDRLD